MVLRKESISIGNAVKSAGRQRLHSILVIVVKVAVAGSAGQAAIQVRILVVDASQQPHGQRL